MQVTVFSELFNYDIEEAKRMTKEKLALEVIDRLKKEYPDAGCTLDYAGNKRTAGKLHMIIRKALSG